MAYKSILTTFNCFMFHHAATQTFDAIYSEAVAENYEVKEELSVVCLFILLIIFYFF